jgi:hypothetical protein
MGGILTVEDILDLVLDILGGFGMGDNETGGTGVEGG